MKLSHKTLMYSVAIAAILVGMIMAYFIWLFPSLYVDYKNNQNLQSVVEVQKGYMKNKSYQGLKVQSPTSTITVAIPFQGEEIFLAGKSFQFDITVKDAQMKTILNQIREVLQKDNFTEEDFEQIEWEKAKESLKKNSQFQDAPVSVQSTFYENIKEFEESGSSRVHIIDNKDGSIQILESSVKDQENQYTSYVAFGKNKHEIVVTCLSVMTPQMREITPVVLGSIPMIVCVLFLVILLCSYYFSKKIVEPVITLADYAKDVEILGKDEIEPLEIHSKDEIGQLGTTLNQLYERLHESYKELEEKNKILAKENKRQEVFLRASSHQLKTPVTAALLLVDGMIEEVGKYQDTKTYLPKVKEQILSMRKIIEDILYLNHSTDHLQQEEINLNLLVRQVILLYQVQIEEKQIQIEIKTGKNSEEETIISDASLTKKMIDNLISNAVAYTENGKKIVVETGKDGIRVWNEGAHIDEEILPHIYEPFVSGEVREKGKGIGLYITAYYSEVLGFELKIQNVADGVEAVMRLKR